MRITAITQQKRDPSRYNIFIDGAYAFALPMQDILYFFAVFALSLSPEYPKEAPVATS